MHIPKPLRITREITLIELAPSPYSFIMNICQINMNVLQGLMKFIP